jgi:hypothetical protein
VCFLVVACNGGGDSGHDGNVGGPPGGGGVVGGLSSAGGLSSGGGNGGGTHPKANGSPLRIPRFDRTGLPIIEGTGLGPSVYSDLIKEFTDECGGTLCVTLKREFTGAGQACTYVGMRPPENAVFHRGAHCPEDSDSGDTTTPSGTDPTPETGQTAPTGTETVPASTGSTETARTPGAALSIQAYR